MANYSRQDADSGDVQANQTGTLSAIWRKSIPEGETVSLGYGAVRDPLFRVYTEDTFNGNNSKTTFSLTSDVVENPRMSSTDGDVVAYVDDSKTTDFSVDYVNDEITFDSAPSSGTDNVEIYYIFEGGQFEIVVENNDQAGQTDTVLEEALRSLHRVDQLDNPVTIDEAHLKKPNNLVAKLRADTQISTSERAPHVLRFPYVAGRATESEVDEYQKQIGLIG